MPSHPASVEHSASPTTCLDDFAVQIGFASGSALVGVRGELDAHTAPTLRNVLVGLADSGHANLVLDLAALTFLGAGGLGVIAHTAGRVRELGGALTIASPTAHARKVLDITGISRRMVITDADATAGLRADLVRLASNPTRSSITDGRLLDLVALASVVVPGADGVSVSLQRHGRLTTVAASNDTVLRMDDHQYDTGEGPCVSAAAEGRRFVIEALADETRWPAFVPRAMTEGIAGIVSTPLLATDQPIGALNIYSSAARAFGSHQLELAAVFASHAADIATSADAEITDEEMDVRIGEALGSRATLSRAQGVLMARHRLTADEATALLHRRARSAGTTTLSEATDVVASTADRGSNETSTSG